MEKFRKLFASIVPLNRIVDQRVLLVLGNVGIICVTFTILISSIVFAAQDSRQAAEESVETYTLSDIIRYAVAHSPGLKQAEKNVEIERQAVRAAKGERLPKLDLGGGVTRYHYPTPVTPISGSPFTGVPFPEFSETIYDAGAFLVIPIYKGGRLVKNVELSELRQSAAADTLAATRRDLVYNLTSVYYKILQLNRLVEAKEAQVKELEAHEQQVRAFVKSGKVARVEILKSEVEVAKAREGLLLAENAGRTAYEVLRKLMGMEDAKQELRVREEPANTVINYQVDEALNAALKRRPDYLSSVKKMQAAEKRVQIAKGRRLPNVFLAGQYVETSGSSIDPKENWNASLRLSLPIFDGGIIDAEIEKERAEFEKAKQNELSMRLEINQEVKDSFINLENAGKRIEVTSQAIESARENLRVETLKYRAGSGTTADLVDAQANLTRVETDYYQALFDRDISVAGVQRAVGEDLFGEVHSK